MKKTLLALLLAILFAVPAESATIVRENVVWYRVHFGTGHEQNRITSPELTAFLDSIVTPRFPEGFTVTESRGQWASKEHGLIKEISFVLDIQCPDSVECTRKIREIAEAYVAKFTRAQASCYVMKMPKITTTLYY